MTLADRSLHVLFGHPGDSGSDRTHLHTPDDAYMLPDGTLTVADAYNCRILFIKAPRDRPPVRHLRRVPARPPALPRTGQRRHADAGRGLLVSEIEGSWIDVISPDRQAHLRRQSAGQLPLRPAAAAGRAHPARRLRDPGPRAHRQPARAHSVALRPGAGARRARTTRRWRALSERRTSPSTTTTTTAWS